MPGKIFVDTNILLYAHDVDAGEKHERAKHALSQLWANRSGVLSPQVLQEFYVNVTRKLSKPLARKQAQKVLDTYSVWCTDTSAAEVLAASRIEEESKISFWDALICASALKAGAERIYSEDLNAGQRISGVQIENPLGPHDRRR
jgi:predicted nucleic acid-binding protein